MKKAFLLINLICCTLFGHAAQLLPVEKGRISHPHVNTASSGQNRHFRQFLPHWKTPADLNQPDAEKLTKQAGNLAVLGLVLTLSAIILTFFTQVITSLPLFIAMLVVGGILGIVGIRKALKVIRNTEADVEQKNLAKIALAGNILVVFLALLPAIAVLLEPLLTT